MGSTGKAGSAALPTTPQAVTPTGLQEGDSQDVIQKYYSDNYGITIGGSYFRDNLSTKILVRASQVLDKLSSELDPSVLRDMGIRVTSMKLDKNTYGQTNLLNHMIGLNSQMFQSYDTVKANMHQDVSRGFHPKGSQAADVLIHEIGHNFEFLIAERQSKGNQFALLSAFNGQSYSKAIVQAAYAELKKEQPTLYRSERQARRAISGYADSKTRQGTIHYSETLAEAVSDYGRNGQNANPMSIKIWQGIKEMLK